MTEKLKPCPFCGMPAVMHNENGIDTLYYVSCSCCAAHSNTGTQEEVTDAWNRRADEEKLRDELKKVMYAMSLIPDGSAHSAKGILARVVHELWPREEQEAQEWQSY